LDNLLCYIWFHMLSWAKTVLSRILNLAFSIVLIAWWLPKMTKHVATPK
jgi:hypothetical protein